MLKYVFLFLSGGLLALLRAQTNLPPYSPPMLLQNPHFAMIPFTLGQGAGQGARSTQYIEVGAEQQRMQIDSESMHRASDVQRATLLDSNDFPTVPSNAVLAKKQVVLAKQQELTYFTEQKQILQKAKGIVSEAKETIISKLLEPCIKKDIEEVYHAAGRQNPFEVVKPEGFAGVSTALEQGMINNPDLTVKNDISGLLENKGHTPDPITGEICDLEYLTEFASESWKDSGEHPVTNLLGEEVPPKLSRLAQYLGSLDLKKSDVDLRLTIADTQIARLQRELTELSSEQN